MARFRIYDVTGTYSESDTLECYQWTNFSSGRDGLAVNWNTGEFTTRDCSFAVRYEGGSTKTRHIGYRQARDPACESSPV